MLLVKLRGQNGEDAKGKRANSQRAMREHIAKMLSERASCPGRCRSRGHQHPAWWTLCLTLGSIWCAV